MESAALSMRPCGVELRGWQSGGQAVAVLGVSLWLLFSGVVWLLGGCTDRHARTPLAPRIESSPSHCTVHPGEQATLKVVATGTGPLRYDWRRAGVSLDGAGGASYTTPKLTAADDGASYVVVVSNEAGSVMSGEARVRVR